MALPMMPMTAPLTSTFTRLVEVKKNGDRMVKKTQSRIRTPTRACMAVNRTRDASFDITPPAGVAGIRSPSPRPRSERALATA